MTKKYVPTNEDKAKVEALTSFGVTAENIAEMLGISLPTLRKNFERELRIARATANAKVANALFKAAVQDSNITAQIFWLKTRAGWKETNVQELTGPDGKPLAVPTLGDFYKTVGVARVKKDRGSEEEETGG